MSFWLFVKVFGDVCIYFSVISAFPGLFDYTFSFLWPAVLCGAGAAMSDLLTEHARPGLRYLCLALPLSVFFLAGSTVEYLILIPAAAYAAVMILRNRNQLEYYGYRQFLKNSILIWCVYFTMICLLYYFEFTTQPWRGSLDYRTPLLCGLLYMLCGVLMLRQLRMGENDGGGALNGIQLAAVLGGIGLTLLGLVWAERLLRDRASSLLEVLRKALIGLFTAPLTVVTQIVSIVLPGRLESLLEPSQEQVRYTEPPAEGGFPPPVLDSAIQQTEETGFPWWLVAVILIVMLAVMLCMMRVFQKRRALPKTAGSAGKVALESRGSAYRERSNRSKIRQIYRKFLKQQRGSGVKLRTDQTSEYILKHISRGTNAQAAARLRQVYISARYDESHEITPEDVAIAKTALAQMRSEKEDNL